MGEQTAIAWTDHTFNPWMGCTKVSPACDHCYAEALGKRTGRVQWGDDAERVVTSDAYWRNPLKWDAQAADAGMSARVFCASMADVFEDRPELIEPRRRLFDLIERTPHLTWQLLTKRPENVMRLAPQWWTYPDGGRPGSLWPAHVWVGTTIEDQQRANERIPHLARVPAPVRFVSCEPVLGPIDLREPWIVPEHAPMGDGIDFIDWVICGGESGGHHRPLDLEHARSLRDQCREARVAFFFKQVGGRTPTAGGDLLDGVQHKNFPKEAA